MSGATKATVAVVAVVVCTLGTEWIRPGIVADRVVAHADVVVSV